MLGQLTQESGNKVQIHIVEPGTPLFQQGRALAKSAYYDIWGTKKMSDDYDAGIVIVADGEVVANLNIRLRDNHRLLPSERFFRPKHWQDYFDGNPLKVAEMCSLAVDKHCNGPVRAVAFAGLIIGSHIIANAHGLDLYTTVQRDFLIKRLQKAYQYKFIANEVIKEPCADVPDDRYWSQNPLPRLYYVYPQDMQTVMASFRLICSLICNDVGIYYLNRAHSAAEIGDTLIAPATAAVA
ncbi:MAG: hypothetical protein FD165_1980 [Gammaproteobacteria bacterium]|nr:MAG: hypothetical protein FD165_1980 [Gammaproteobacteria bacterium]TND04973.1 MAG: hypothetical protein FD120_1251 [Gammaproteobacteria bacterium]